MHGSFILLMSNRLNDDADFRIFWGTSAFADAVATGERLAHKWDTIHIRPVGSIEEYVK